MTQNPVPFSLFPARRCRVPVIQAGEIAECGLACLAMVARYHGHDLDLNGLRQRYAFSGAGVSLSGLLAVAQDLELGGRALRIEMSALPRLRLPAVLHWDMNHFVVLVAVNTKQAVIHDPARGRCVLALEEVSRHMTGVALELTPTQSFEPISARLRMRLSSLWSSAQGAQASLFQVLLLSFVLQIAIFAAPFQLQLVVDDALLNGDANLLVVLALGFGALVLGQAMIEALRNWVIQLMGNTMVFQVMGNIVQHLVRLSAGYFEKRHIGDLMSRMGSLRPIEDALTRGLVMSLVDGVMAMIAVAILFFYSVQLTFVVLGMLALSLLVSLVMIAPFRRAAEEEILAQAKEQTHLIETIRAIGTIKIMGREAERLAHWRNLFAQITNAANSRAKLQVILAAIQQAIAGLQSVVVIYLGASLVISKQGFSVGMLLAFLSFRQTFTDRFMNLVNQWFQFRLLGLHLDRLGDIVAAPAEYEPAKCAPRRFEGHLRLSQVGFRYGATDRPVLSNVDLSIVPEDFIAITGPSGGGKTTLVKLLLGLAEPTSGVIELDSLAATPELWRAWRDSVGYVSQSDCLLNGTIADNIAFFDADLDIGRVHAAAQMAQVHEDILRMPMQYLSLVGDMGSTLSGGQKQRVLLARALYRNPRILVLDEGTANLDPQTEEVIADLIQRLPITRIVVAHRPALIRRARRVLHVAGGTVLEALPGRDAAHDEEPRSASHGQAEMRRPA